MMRGIPGDKDPPAPAKRRPGSVMLGATEWRLEGGDYCAVALGCQFRIKAEPDADGHHYGSVTDLRDGVRIWLLKVKPQRQIKHMLMDAHEQFRIHRARETGVG